jgi:CRP-like cAMP-binding protein
MNESMLRTDLLLKRLKSFEFLRGLDEATLVDLTVDLSLRTEESRLAKLLLEQAKDDIIPRQRWLTLTELAARLGTVPDVLGRVIRELSRAELIEMGKHQIAE